MPKATIKDIIPFKYTLQEGSDDGRFKVRGVFQRAEQRNANGRVYPRSLWEKILGDKSIKEMIETRSMIGELDHPNNDSEVKLQRGSHIITSLTLEDDGTISGEAEIMDTPNGKILKEYFRSGARVGISSRGNGSTIEEDDSEVVAEDFELQTFDFVANPSTFGAYPKRVQESKEQTTMAEKVVTEAVDPTSAERFAQVRSKATELLSRKPNTLSLTEKATFQRDVENLVVEATRLGAEDAGYSTLVSDITKKLTEKVQTVEKAPNIEARMEAAQGVIRSLSEKVKTVEGLQKKVAFLEKWKRAAIAEGNELLAKHRGRRVFEADLRKAKPIKEGWDTVMTAKLPDGSGWDLVKNYAGGDGSDEYYIRQFDNGGNYVTGNYPTDAEYVGSYHSQAYGSLEDVARSTGARLVRESRKTRKPIKESVSGYVDTLLGMPKYTHLKPMRNTLLKLESRKEVNNLIEKLTRSKSKVTEGKGKAITKPIVETAKPATPNDPGVTQLATRAQKVGTITNLRY